MVEHPGPAADSVREMLAAEESRQRQHLVHSSNLGGLVVTAVGALLTLFLMALEVPEPVYFLGLIPLAVGLLILATGRRLRKDENAADR